MVSSELRAERFTGEAGWDISEAVMPVKRRRALLVRVTPL